MYPHFPMGQVFLPPLANGHRRFTRHLSSKNIYTDASSKQLGSVITQGNRPLAFFSRKLSTTQQKYSVTELELLAIVETLKEFKGMLWGQRLKVYTDHKNLIQDALGLTSDRVYRWRLLLEEFGPKLFTLKAYITLLPTPSLA
eukprot:CCRYP_007626-RA/>CCRYP_007626-RA protein AED:0.43 eAED:0.55 QI:0/0/0/1/0/0/2/0/142